MTFTVQSVHVNAVTERLEGLHVAERPDAQWNDGQDTAARESHDHYYSSLIPATANIITSSFKLSKPTLHVIPVLTNTNR